MSAQVIDNDHYCPAVFYEPGAHTIKSDTRYALVVVRIQLFDPKDTAEVALVNALQDQLVIEAGSADPLPPCEWEPESLKALTAEYEIEAKALDGFKGLMGPRGKVDEKRSATRRGRRLGAQSRQGRDLLQCTLASTTPSEGLQRDLPVPENRAFWSITVYGADGYMKSDNTILNSSSVEAERRRDVHGPLRLEGPLRRRPQPARRHARLELRHARLPAGAERPRRELRLPAVEPVK